MPQPLGAPVKLVVLNLLQMGWMESPAYFCVASETARDVATWYAESPMAAAPNHKIIHHAMDGPDLAQLPPTKPNNSFLYFVDVYVNDFIPLAIATLLKQLAHVMSAVMNGIHDVFPPHPIAEQDPISHKKLCKQDGQWALKKDLLGFTLSGKRGENTMQLEQAKQNSCWQSHTNGCELHLGLKQGFHLQSSSQ
jgi:hypothetical protein